ncbi:O-antigen ligase family protein [Frateuria aurantia]
MNQPDARQAIMAVWLWIGTLWLWVGMALCPVNHRVWNPGKYYHQSLAVIYLPAVVWWCWAQRRLLPSALLGDWGGRSFCGLILWAGAGLGWSTHGSLGDGLVIEAGLLLFVSGTAILVCEHPLAWCRVQSGAATGVAFAALVAMLAFPFRDVVWEGSHRLVAFGTWDNPNLAGMGAGAAELWLWLLPAPTRRHRLMRALAGVLLLVFVLWTFSRGTWLALAMALLAMALLRGPARRSARGLAALAIMLPVALWIGWHQLIARGWSYRPQIFSQAIQHIEQAPWLGIGTLSRYHIVVGAQQWEHSHNVWTHLAITLGLPGLALWAGLWLWTGLTAWRWRQLREGRFVAVLWVYGSVTTLLDAPRLFIQPDVEWMLLWLPVALALGLQLRARSSEPAADGDWCAAGRLG